MRCAGHVEGTGKREMHTAFWWGSPEGRMLLERLRHLWVPATNRMNGVHWIYVVQGTDERLLL